MKIWLLDFCFFAILAGCLSPFGRFWESIFRADHNLPLSSGGSGLCFVWFFPWFASKFWWLRACLLHAFSHANMPSLHLSSAGLRFLPCGLGDSFTLWSLQPTACATVSHFGAFGLWPVRQFHIPSAYSLCDSFTLWSLQLAACATVSHFGAFGLPPQKIWKIPPSRNCADSY